MPDPNKDSNTPQSSGAFSLAGLSRSCWIYPLIACFILTVLLSAKKIGTYDLGTHLKAGQWIVQNHSFPAKDGFTYTQTNQDYLDSNSLYQIVLYLLQRAFGYGSLSLLNMAVIFLVFGLLFWRLSLSKAPPWALILLFLASLVAMERRFLIRPEIFSWFFLGSTLLILDLRNRNKDFLYLLPLIQLLWVNIEGLFILGWFAMGAYAFSGWVHQKRWDPKLVRFSLLAVVCDLVNPYFLKGALFPLVLLTRLQGTNLHKQTVSELRSPMEYLATQNLGYDFNTHIMLFFLLAALAVLLYLLTRKQRKVHEWLLMAAFGYMALTAVRNIPLFTLVAVPILATGLGEIGLRRQEPQAKKIALVLTLVVLAFCARVSTNAFYISDRRVDRVGFNLDEERLPVRAADFLVQNHLDGRILNHLDFGGWLDWKAPQPTFIDGRSEVVSDDFYAQYIQSFQGTGLRTLLTLYQPQLILFEFNAAMPWAEQLRHFSDWRLIYLDECAALYARQDYAKGVPTLSLPSLLTARNISSLSDEALASLLQQNPPSKTGAWLNGFFKPQTYPMGLFSMGLFALKAGEYPTARDFFVEGFRQTGGGYEEVFYNLGVANLHLKNYVLGRSFLEKVLFFDPQDSSTLQMLSSLNRL